MPNEAQAVVLAKQELPEVTLTAQDIQTLVTVGALPAGCPPDVIRFFAKACAESRLSPFKRQVHLIKRWSKAGDRYTIQTGIDGYRAIANRTGQYAGNDDCTYDDGKTEFQLLSKKQGCTTATATVYRAVAGVRCPFAATAAWESYCPQDPKMRFMWDRMPFLMLGKCAEALALRKAFPEELGGIYTDEEEMIQADAPKPIKQGVVAVPAEIAPTAPQMAATGTPAAKERTFEQVVDDATQETVELVDYVTKNGIAKKTGKTYTAWTCTFKTDSDSTFEAGTVRSAIGDALPTLKGQLCEIQHKAGKFAGTRELLSIAPAQDEIPMGNTP